jgi:hypothetical protein
MEYEGTKAFLKGGNQVFLLIMIISIFSWIRICIPSTDPDPGQPNQCGSMQIRIHDTELDPEPWIFRTQHFEFGLTSFFYEEKGTYKNVHGVVRYKHKSAYRKTWGNLFFK